MVKGVKRAVAAAQIQRRQTPGALIDDNPAMNQARIDAEGYIVSEADLGNVQPDFEQVPKTAAELLLAGFGSRLHSGYLYGSVVRGNAVPRRSDVDVVAVLQAAPTDHDRGAACRPDDPAALPDPGGRGRGAHPRR